MKASDWKAAVRALVYPVQFSMDPEKDVDRALAALLGRSGTVWTREGLAESVRAALTSRAHLAGLIPQKHSEEVLRRYLAAALRRLMNP
ncbi:MAG: hypothetical protein WC943_00435 [Elusimicrobiota bacterium]|jgi:hypothetical protein